MCSDLRWLALWHPYPGRKQILENILKFTVLKPANLKALKLIILAPSWTRLPLTDLNRKPCRRLFAHHMSPETQFILFAQLSKMSLSLIGRNSTLAMPPHFLGNKFLMGQRP